MKRQNILSLPFDIENFYEKYICATASQHLLTEVWVKKEMFEELYMNLESLMQPSDKTIDCSKFDKVVAGVGKFYWKNYTQPSGHQVKNTKICKKQ